MFQRCPKCGHHPLPADQALPAACPACGVILAKVAQGSPPRSQSDDLARARRVDMPTREAPSATNRLLHVPDSVQATGFWPRVLLWAGFAIWGWYLIALDYREGEINTSFIHGPLLVFHEAGHVLFRPFGEWLTVLGGTLGQLIMPAILDRKSVV